MAELLLELLSEEMPAGVQKGAAEDLKRLIASGLKEAGLSFESMRAFVTPRRLGLVVDGLPEKQPGMHSEKRGPRVGAPDEATAGFATASGIHPEKLAQRSTPKGDYYFATIDRPGLPTSRALVPIIEAAMDDMPWPKAMRWANTEVRWVRPLHGILAVFDSESLVLTYDLVRGRLFSDLDDGSSGAEASDPGLRSVKVDFDEIASAVTDPSTQWQTIEADNVTVGHRVHAPQPFAVTGFADYERKLRAAHVLIDWAERRAIILEGAERLAAEAGLRLRQDEGLLDELAGLVEWPVMLRGAIDADYMSLPDEVLIAATRNHQRYLATETPEEKLGRSFIIVANIEANDDGKAIVAGNERVLRARLADARFFWDQDRKISLSDRVPKLAEMIYHSQLGTEEDKTKRVTRLASEVVRWIPEADPAIVKRAAFLSKADLITEMVGEFPELQGIVGRYYALSDGEREEVADALADYYPPHGLNDRCPTRPEGVSISLASKIDTLVAFFAIDQKPTGSRDPFALRRAALGAIRLIIENGLRIPLLRVFEGAFVPIGSHLEQNSTEAFDYVQQLSRHLTQQQLDDENLEVLWERGGWRSLALKAEARVVGRELLTFFADRLKVHLRERDVRHDLISAVFALTGEDDLVRLLARVEALGAFLKSDDGANLLTAFKRANNIVAIEERKDGKVYDGGGLSESLLVAPEEIRLHEALARAEADVIPAIEKEDFTGACRAFARLRAPIDAFFDHVTVNTDDPPLRENRLRLLDMIRARFLLLADFSLIEG